MSDEGLVLVRVNKMLIVFEARAWPMRGGELLSRHRTWGAAETARRRIEPLKPRKRAPAAPEGQQQGF